MIANYKKTSGPRMRQFYKQPLFHFLLAGVLIFIAYGFSDVREEVPATSPGVIEVDRATLLNFMQYRAQAFDPVLFGEQLDAMSEADIARLVDAYVREEALHREALAMGMDQGDYIIRQRLVQKVEFLLENLVNEALEPDEAEIRDWYEARRTDYQVDADYTFTHIFFDGGERGQDNARRDAEALLADPALAGVAFNDASQYGDRYPFLQNYVERTRDFVVNNFTEDFVARLDALTPGDGAWHGPFESRYGWHLVLLRQRTDPYVPGLDQIRDRVLDDWRFETVQANRREAEDQVVAGYEVRLDLGTDARDE